MAEYLKFKGTCKFAQVYTPDEFRGAVRWKMNFYPESEEELKKLQGSLNSNKVLKEDEDGKFFPLYRPTTKTIKGRLVHFSPPIIYDRDGDPLVSYVDKSGKIIRSYDDPKNKPEMVGEPVLIGNGSEVEITLCVYQTAMGPGNRLESIRLIDLIEYIPPEGIEDDDPAGEEDKGQEEKAPW